MQEKDISLILVLSSWSSGSTAVTGFLDKCGCYSCPPHLPTQDERTPNCYEPLDYRQALREVVDENTLEPKGDARKFCDFFSIWLANEREKAANTGASSIVLKHPLQAFLLPAIQTITDSRCVVVTRPFDDIEATRRRRLWAPSYGAVGAEVIYGTIYHQLHQSGRPFITVPYDPFCHDITVRNDLVNYLGVSPTASQRGEAEAFIHRTASHSRSNSLPQNPQHLAAE